MTGTKTQSCVVTDIMHVLAVYSVRKASIAYLFKQSAHMWSRNKINSVLETIYFISAPHVRTTMHALPWLTNVRLLLSYIQ